MSIINKDRVSVPFESTSVGDLHDMRMTEGAAKQSRDAFLATEPEPYLAENYEKAPLSDNPFREDRIS